MRGCGLSWESMVFGSRVLVWLEWGCLWVEGWDGVFLFLDLEVAFGRGGEKGLWGWISCCSFFEGGRERMSRGRGVDSGFWEFCYSEDLLDMRILRRI